MSSGTGFQPAFVVQTYQRTAKGRVVEAEKVPSICAEDACHLAQVLAARQAGAVVFAIRGDAGADVLAVFGQIPAAAVSAYD